MMRRLFVWWIQGRSPNLRHVDLLFDRITLDLVFFHDVRLND